MKTILVLSIFFYAIALPALGELTDADLDKIRLIVKEEVKTEITASEKRTQENINLKIEALDKSLNARINELDKSLNARIDAVHTRIDAVDKRVGELEESLSSRIGDMWLVVLALIGFVAAAIAIPQIIIANTEKRRQQNIEREHQDLQAEIQQLRGRLETLENPPS